MIVDSHAHFWKKPPPGNPNIGPEHDPIEVDEFVRHMDAARVDKVLQITRGVMGFDNSYSIEGASRYPDRMRVLGRIDAGAPDIVEQLRGWKKQPYMVGLRLMVHFPTEAGWYADGTMDRFWPEAERCRIPVSIYAPERSSLVASIAQRHASLPLVVDHIGMRTWDVHRSVPSTADWPNLLALAKYSNVTIKVSGIPEAMVERYPGFHKSRERLREIYDRFGPERMIWGSNFPPTTQVCSYEEAIAFIEESGFLSAADKSKILAGNAIRVFGLPW